MRTIGGILDFYFIIGENPEDSIQKYHNVYIFFNSHCPFNLTKSKLINFEKLIGRPIFPPYFALGFQISRWGYDKLEDVKAVVSRTKEAKIPQVTRIIII